jgi:hypothetical protein
MGRFQLILSRSIAKIACLKLGHFLSFISFSQITYRRGRLIGKGGFAKVYEVTELVTNKCYADKVTML